MSRHIIAGIDPGATIGIAILDLCGGKIAAESASNGISGAVKIIEGYGTPSLVCCDVVPAPEMVQRIASYFSCRLYAPQQNIREEDKRLVARGAGMENNHERDAYAAAVYGFRAHANKLRRIDSLPELSLPEKEQVKHLLMKGYRIKDAFAAIGEIGQEEEPIAGRKTVPEPAASSPAELKARISGLARENANLRLLAERLENEKSQLEVRVRRLENGVRETVLRDSELRKLRFRLQQSLSRLGFRKQEGQKPRHAEEEGRKTPLPNQPKGHDGEKGQKQEDDVLNVEEERLDLEKMVMDYRRGKHRRA